MPDPPSSAGFEVSGVETCVSTKCVKGDTMTNPNQQSGSSPPQAATAAATAVDLVTAKAEIGAAWQSHKKSTRDFGRVCHEWAQRFEKSKGGYGSNGTGLSEILNVLNIPRHIVDYAISVHKASIGEGIPCPSCRETFPSKTQLRKHQHKKHAVPNAQVAPTPQMPTAASAVEDDPERDAAPAPKSNFNKEGTRGFEDKEAINLFVRRLRVIVESSPNAPFAKTMEDAFNECDETEVQVVLSHLNQAIERLGEYHAKFDKKFARKK
jgi:hypothetical protein